MKDVVFQRISEVLDYSRLSKKAFANKLGMEQTTVNNQFLGKRGISIDLILNTLFAFPDISAEWLLRGTGNMIKNNEDTPISIDDNSIVYHYTSIKNLFSIIGNEQLKLSELKYTNDLREINNDCGYKCLCFCIGDDAYKKPRMWAQYGDNNKGVCIGFKLGKLKEMAESLNSDIESFPIQYKEEAFFKYQSCNGKESLKFKLEDWKNENEYRFISQKSDFIPISLDCIECVYVGVDIPVDFDAITKIGINDKLRTFMVVGGVLRNSFFNHYAQKIENSDSQEMNGHKINIGRIVNIENINENRGRINARRFYDELGNLKGYSHIPANNYADLIRENERLRTYNEILRKKVDAYEPNTATDAAKEQKGA